MNKYAIVNGLYRQNVYNVRDGRGHYKNYTRYYNLDFSFFLVSIAGTNRGLIDFKENKNPKIIFVSKKIKKFVNFNPARMDI
jgi:hypothetical protein